MLICRRKVNFAYGGQTFTNLEKFIKYRQQELQNAGLGYQELFKVNVMLPVTETKSTGELVDFIKNYRVKCGDFAIPGKFDAMEHMAACCTRPVTTYQQTTKLETYLNTIGIPQIDLDKMAAKLFIRSC